MTATADRSRQAFSDVSEGRRRNMAAIRAKNTQPEMLVRRLVHRMGYRYRLYVRTLPGCPDLVFPRHHKIIEVRGCFWHRHPGCIYAATPRTRPDFWRTKFADTVLRDSRNVASLQAKGWAVLIVWECETATPDLGDRLRRFLAGQPPDPSWPRRRHTILSARETNG
jgi:DNA mismatch endonuclease Vsr